MRPLGIARIELRAGGGEIGGGERGVVVLPEAEGVGWVEGRRERGERGWRGVGLILTAGLRKRD